MGFDVQKWLKEEMKFSEAEAAEMAAKFTGERVASLEAGYASAADRATIAANRQELEKAQADLRASSDKLTAEIAEWANLTAAEKGQATELRASLEASQAEVLKMRQAVERIAGQAGIDPKTVLPTEPVVTKTEPTVQKFDTSNLVDRDTFSKLMQFSVDLPAQLQYAADEHFALTGKRLDTRTIVAEIKKRAGNPNAVVDPIKIWEEQHNIPKLREEKSAAERAAEIAAAEARGEERARSSMSVPGAHQTRSVRPSPVLSTRTESGQFAARTSVLKRPAPGSITNSAAAAFRSGKYREKVG